MAKPGRVQGSTTTNPSPSTCKRADNAWSEGRPRPCGPCGGALGLLEQLGLGGWLEAGDAAEVGRRARLGKAEGLAPQTLVAEEALDALGVADQGAKLHASPAVGAGVDGQAQGEQDITSATMAEIIFEEEKRSPKLPVEGLRRIIRNELPV